MKRYGIKFTGTYPIAEMAEHPNGKYVALADHVDRVKQLEEALRELADAARSATDARKHTPLINALANADALLNGGSNERA